MSPPLQKASQQTSGGKTMILCRITERDDGEPVPKSEQVWCLRTPYADGDQTFCSGEYYGDREGGAKADEKRVKRGGITCSSCLDKIAQIKAVRL